MPQWVPVQVWVSWNMLHATELLQLSLSHGQIIHLNAFISTSQNAEAWLPKPFLKKSLLSLADNFTFKVCHLPLLVEQQYLHWYSSVTVLITVAVVTCLKTEIIALFSFVVFCRVLHNRCVVCMYVCALSLTWKFIVSQVNCSGSHGLEYFVVSRFHGYWILIMMTLWCSFISA